MFEKNQMVITKILLDQGKISQEEFQEIVKGAEKSNVNPDEFLQQQRIVSEEEVVQAKSIFFKIPIIELRGRIIDKEVLNILSQEMSEEYKAIVFDQEQDKIKVALVNPENLKIQEVINFIAKNKKKRVEYYLTSLSSWRNAFLQYTIGGLGGKIEEAIKFVEQHTRLEDQESLLETKEKKITKEAPITELVTSILTDATESNASDIHIEPTKDHTVVRYRIDGILRPKITLPNYLHSVIVSRIKVMANLKLDETRIPQDGRIRVNLLGRFIDVRVSTLPLLDKEKVVLRILDPTKDIFNLEALGFWGKGLEVIKSNIKKPFGMFLVTGPTGCGKTTTLYSLLQILNQPEVNIVTLEDPIEYILPGINQSQIKPSIGYTFASGLRTIIRQDPNIIMVGEIRDNETAELAVHAALTGHIVLSTLHTNNAFGAIPRLLDMGVEPFLIVSSVNIVIAQRLARKICSFCKIKIENQSFLEKVERDFLNQFSSFTDVSEVKEILKNKISIYKSKGCFHCKNEGFIGRLAIFEVLEITEKMKEIILRGCHLDEVKAEFNRQRIFSMYQDGLIKVAQGLTTYEEILRVIKEE